MRTISILFVAVIVLVLIGVAVLPSLGLWAKGKVGTIDRKIQDDISLEEARNLKESQIEKDRQSLFELHREVYSLESDRAQLEGTVNGHKSQLEREKGILKRSCEILNSHKPGETVVVGGQSMPWNKLNQDALERANRYQVLLANVQTEAKILTSLDTGITEGKAKIDKLMVKIRQAKVALDVEYIKGKALETLEKVDSRLGLIHDFDIGGSRSKADEIWDRKLKRLEADAALRARTVTTGHVSNDVWDRELNIPGENAVEVINSILGTDSVVPAPSTSPATPVLVD